MNQHAHQPRSRTGPRHTALAVLPADIQHNGTPALEASVTDTHAGFTGLLFLPLISHLSAKCSLNGMTDDNFLPKALMPKNGIIDGNVHFCRASFHFLPEQQEKVGIFNHFIVNSLDT